MRKSSHTCFKNGYTVIDNKPIPRMADRNMKQVIFKKNSDKIPHLISSTTVVTLQIAAVRRAGTAKGPGGKARVEF